MNDDSLNKLEDRIDVCLNKLESLDPASEEYAQALKSLAALNDILGKNVESNRKFIDQCNQDTHKETELKMKAVEADRSRTEFFIKLAVDGAAILVPCLCYIGLINKGYRIENDGVIKSSILRNLINKFKISK